MNFETDSESQLSGSALKSRRELLRQPTDTSPYGVFEQRGDRTFAALISKRMELICDLEILLLRHQAPGQLISDGGDLDNRLKTLFDALRIPTNSEAKQLGTSPSVDSDPFHCLLQDDALVTRLSVETDRLLVESAPHQLVAIIAVNLRPSRASSENLELIS